MMRTAIAMAMLLTLGTSSAQASLMIEWPVREQVLRSDVMLIAEPVEWSDKRDQPSRFKIVEILNDHDGSVLRPGDVILVATGGSRRDGLRYQPAWQKDQKKEEPAPIDRVLFFLSYQASDYALPHFSTSSIRCRTTAGELLEPAVFASHGPAFLVSRKDGNWDDEVKHVRGWIDAVQHVLALRKIRDVRERNRAILSWIAEHQDEFGDGALDGRGWGSLQVDTLTWVVESGVLADCWRALVLGRGAVDGGRFGTPAGRQLLAGIAADERAEWAERRLALRHLADKHTMWPNANRPGISWPQGPEQLALLRLMKPLLRAPDESLRQLAVRTVGAMTILGTETAAQALAELVAVYRAESDSDVTTELRRAIQKIAGEEYLHSLCRDEP